MKIKERNYLFEINEEESEFCGEQFIVQVLGNMPKDLARKEARKIANNIFPGTRPHFICYLTPYEAEAIGLDTY